MAIEIKEGFSNDAAVAGNDIFHTPAFYALHQNEKSLFFSFLSENKVLGTIHLTEVEEGIFQSPFRGTYSGFSFSENCTYIEMESCVTALISHLQNSFGAHHIIIKNAPFAHDIHRNTLIFNILLNKNFKISQQEVNHTLEIDEQSLVEKMKRNNKKRFNKCERNGFVFQQLDTEEGFEKAYQVIVENRESKGYAVSMTFAQLMEMKAVFPNDIYFFQATFEEKIAASSVCIRLNSKILYVFYWGDKPGFEEYSPVVFLANGIYQFAQNNHFTILDAGTSSLNGILNQGVATFKEGLGFSSSLKLTYDLKLS
jgi:hypothetical protein